MKKIVATVVGCLIGLGSFFGSFFLMLILCAIIWSDSEILPPIAALILVIVPVVVCVSSILIFRKFHAKKCSQQRVVTFPVSALEKSIYVPEVVQSSPEQTEYIYPVEDSKDRTHKLRYSDELFPTAVDIILEVGQATVSLLQRRLYVGYARGARLVDEMEAKGIIGPYQGSIPRKILIRRNSGNY